jgi:hypothetical protein
MTPEQYMAHAQRIALRIEAAEDAMQGIDIYRTGDRAVANAAAVAKFLDVRGMPREVR